MSPAIVWWDWTAINASSFIACPPTDPISRTHSHSSRRSNGIRKGVLNAGRAHLHTARPDHAGALGAEVWVRPVDANQPKPTNPSEIALLTMTNRPSFRVEFKTGDGGGTAGDMARWVNTPGEERP